MQQPRLKACSYLLNITIIHLILTFLDLYDEWSKRKFPTIFESNVKGYTASYKTCESLYNKVFKDNKLVDLQTVIDTCVKIFPH